MHPEKIHQSRRDFLATYASGIDALALDSLLRDDGLLAAAPFVKDDGNPLAPRPPHFTPKAKACICSYLEGPPTQRDLSDPKPKLNYLDGKALPESTTKNVLFVFIKKVGARLMGSPRKFTKHGQCGMELSDL